LNLNCNNLGTPGFVALLESLRFSVVSHLEVASQRLSYSRARIPFKLTIAFNNYIPRLVCLASVRTIPRIGVQSCHFRELSSDILIRVMQTLGWLIDYQETIRMLKEDIENEK